MARLTALILICLISLAGWGLALAQRAVFRRILLGTPLETRQSLSESETSLLTLIVTSVTLTLKEVLLLPLGQQLLAYLFLLLFLALVSLALATLIYLQQGGMAPTIMCSLASL